MLKRKRVNFICTKFFSSHNFKCPTKSPSLYPILHSKCSKYKFFCCKFYFCFYFTMYILNVSCIYVCVYTFLIKKLLSYSIQVPNKITKQRVILRYLCARLIAYNFNNFFFWGKTTQLYHNIKYNIMFNKRYA